MLKYSDKINKLSDAQKIRILSSVGNISGKDMKNIGIPVLRMGNMKNFERSTFPHVTSLSHAWNTSLWTDVASLKVQKMAESGINFAIAPGAKIKLSPFRKETTEDPYLAALISGAYMKAANDAHMTVCASGYYVTESDVAWMDKEPSERVLNEFILSPYARAAQIAADSGVVTDLRIPNEAYAGACAYLQRKILGQTEFLICENADDFNTVLLVSKGVICLNGSANALSAALLRYRKLKKLLEQGKDITLLKIEKEEEVGTAISDETLDFALDRVLDFLFRVQDEKKCVVRSSEQEEQLSLKAALESTVLLKNRKEILPLSSSQSIAVIDGFSSKDEDLGELCCKELEACGYECCTEKLQDALEKDAHKRIKKINQACRNAKVTLLLLGSGYAAERKIHKTEKLTLPPEQLDLVDQVAMNAENVVAIVFSEHGTDLEFTRLFDGVIFAPLPIRHTSKALAKILSGRYNPSARLSYTLYMGTETSLKKGESYLRNFGMKAGPFIGYRYYDKANLRVGYPFGYGLSYTEFIYSDLSINGDTVSFTVQNFGQIAGSEVAQLYVGLDDSSLLRPKKELCGFAKVYLEPKESKRISIKLELPKVFDRDAFVLEKGSYSVYIGASVLDIRLTGKLFAGDAVLSKKDEKISDYLQTYSNILNDHYTLEANYSVMKKGFTNIIAGTVALMLAIVLAVFNISTYRSSLALGVISGILALGAIALFITEIVERSRLHEANRQKIREENQEHFKDAEQIPVLSAEKMFEDQFDTVEEEPVHVNEVVQSMDLEEDYSQYIDEQFKLKDAAEEFARFAMDRGFKLERGVVENLFASFSVSRLLILNGLSSEEYNSFVLLLSEYFGCTACIDNASEHIDHHDGINNVFFARDTEGYHTQKNIFKALNNAGNLIERVHLSAIDDMTEEHINDWLAPLMRYLRSTKRKNEVVIPDERGKKWSFHIGNNFWVLLRLAAWQAADTLPIDIVKCASVVNVSMEKCQPSEDPMASHGFSSYQMEYMLWQVSGKHEVTEETWKKIDKLEKYAQSHASYTIGNKLWLDVEKQMEALLACDLEPNEATDAVIASRILPSVSVALKDRLNEDEQTVLQAAEFIFGIDNVQYMKAYIDSLDVKELPPMLFEESEVSEEAVEEAVEDVVVSEESEEESASKKDEAEAESAADINQPTESEGTPEADSAIELEEALEEIVEEETAEEAIAQEPVEEAIIEVASAEEETTEDVLSAEQDGEEEIAEVTTIEDESAEGATAEEKEGEQESAEASIEAEAKDEDLEENAEK